MGKITKFMVPAKFSSWRMWTDNISPSAASMVALSNIAGKTASQPQVASTPKAQATAIKTSICTKERAVLPASLTPSSQPRGSGAVSSKRITPISRS